MIDKRKFKKIQKNLSHFKIQKLNLFLITFLVFISFLSGILFTKLTNLKTQTLVSDSQTSQKTTNQANLIKLQNEVIKKNYSFKIKWANLGQKMVSDGVIDKTKLAQAITKTDNLPEDLDRYFSGNQNQIEVNQQNAQFWVDVLWGFGLANKNRILDGGQMMENGDASQFASTGGWTLGASDPMNYYSKFNYINLSDNQQKEVEQIASNIYRPCCGNSTAFPDCNHGMAALGLIELMVSQNFSKNDIYKTVLAFNTYWFPETYLNIAYHFDKAGQNYSSIPPKELLSKTFSSAMGAQALAKETQGVQWPVLQNGGSCGA